MAILDDMFERAAGKPEELRVTDEEARQIAVACADGDSAAFRRMMEDIHCNRATLYGCPLRLDPPTAPYKG